MLCEATLPAGMVEVGAGLVLLRWPVSKVKETEGEGEEGGRRGRWKGEVEGGEGEMYYVVFTVVVIGATIIAVALFGFDASVREKKKAKRSVRCVGRWRCAIWVDLTEVRAFGGRWRRMLNRWILQRVWNVKYEVLERILLNR
jgi:hypothetical protein